MKKNRPWREFYERLRALKRTYGKDLAAFPRCFFPRAVPAATQRIPTSLLRIPAPLQADIYGGVSATEVRQRAGKTDENAGELLPTAVSSIIQMIGDLKASDVFVDVGAGLGNIVAQFALQTGARMCLGFETRPEVAQAGVRCVRENVSRFAHLFKVRVLAGDVLDTPLSTRNPFKEAFKEASIVFLNDILFTESAKLVVREELDQMDKVRLIVSTTWYCPRHRDSCQRSFCVKWEQAETIYGSCSWKFGLVPIYLYRPSIG
ncbi:Histone methylation protein [Phytophthora megakarya]|uniref:Histone-lysine N-methyltransferase, H3 lysine-79 specific n=1 Tax=Phytophthora megakarya TaxID=4795 RepID=A0A225UTA0_9STRA|nr:Histone methylation protein [Phytophthora megakarya]